MNNYIYYGIGILSVIVMVYMYTKRPVVNNHHNFDVKDVKRLLKNTEKSNRYVKSLIVQIAKYMKKNNNDKLRLDILNKSSLFEKDYTKTRLVINQSYGSGELSSEYTINYKLNEVFKNVIGFKYISSILNLQLWHPENSNLYTNGGESLTTHPNKFYIDLTIDQIPYIACKKNAEKKHLIERIPIQHKSNDDINHHSPIKQPDIYFYPIKLNNLNINFNDIDGTSLIDIWAITDISIEFEITYIVNETNVGLSTPH